MDKRLADVMEGKEENYVLPLFWQHGDHRSELPGLIQRIRDSGARAFCVESRPHKEFCEAKWWGDMDVILSEAKARGMKVWLLDDKHYPTGYANGLVVKKYPELRKWQIREEHVDVLGPMRGAAVLCNPTDEEEQIIGIFAYRRSGVGEEIEGEPYDLTERKAGPFLYWDVPEGCYRIFFIYKTRKGTSRPTHINMLEPESVRVLLEAVYEPHYQHYREYFGETFAGFFSDEPGFENEFPDDDMRAVGKYEYTLGLPGLSLPWSDALFNRLVSILGGECISCLPGLWYPLKGRSPEIRLTYMDAVTSLYRESFSTQIGRWCQAHGVEYIGHIVEDMNAHARLGWSAGHFFRSMAGQDMSGVDVVLHQILPGFAHYMHSASCAGRTADPEFFHYMLGKLGSSLAHIHPRMEGKAMCEVFGAYGWAEGAPMMKWLVDHMLVRGINRFVPHAFSPKYPDNDCPPHFYADGNDPQFAGYRRLTEYINKACHLLSGAVHKANAAILYHAEAEWMGECMFSQKPARALYDAQIDYDIVPMDSVYEDARVCDGKIRIHRETYDCLIVPYARHLPERFLNAAEKLMKNGAFVFFIDGLPDGCRFDGTIVCLDRLVEMLTIMNMKDVRVEGEHPFLRIYHVVRDSASIFMLSNESVSAAVDADAIFPCRGSYLKLDLLNDVHYLQRTPDGRVHICLQPYQSSILVFDDFSGDLIGNLPEEREWELYGALDLRYDIDVAEQGQDISFIPYRKNSGLFNITGQNGMPDFSGIVRYRARFSLEEICHLCLDLGAVGQTAGLSINGKRIGLRICPPYRYDITDAISQGINTIEIEVSNTLVHRLKDDLSRCIQIPPSGLLGPVSLYRQIP